MKIIKLSQQDDTDAWKDFRKGKVSGSKAKFVKPLIEALELLGQRLKLEVETDPGVWVSSDNENIMVSPDASEKSKTPKWAAEVKCLATKNHLKYVCKDLWARVENYNPIDSTGEFREQIVQYSVVNEKLERLYFVLYDDRVSIDKYMFHIIEIHRKDIEGEVAEQKAIQITVLADVDKLIKEMLK